MMKTNHTYIIILLSLCVFGWGCKQNLIITSTYFQQLNISNQHHADAVFDSIVAPYARSLSASMNEVIGYSEIEMPKLKDEDETILGNWFADALFDIGRTHTNYQIDACMLNIGGIRASLPKGPITRGHIFSIAPFENELVILEVDSHTVAKILHYLTHVKAQPISGFRIKAKRNGNISEKSGNLFSNSNSHFILTSDYLANGGDNMHFFTQAINRIHTGIKIRDAIISYIQQKKNINAALDKRIELTP